MVTVSGHGEAHVFPITPLSRQHSISSTRWEFCNQEMEKTQWAGSEGAAEVTELTYSGRDDSETDISLAKMAATP